MDGKGKPLPAGEDAVKLDWRVYDNTNFNEYDFGKFVNEEEYDNNEGLQD